MTLPAAALPSAGLVPAEALIDRGRMSSAVEAMARSLGTTDLRAAASLWQKWYNYAVLGDALTELTHAGLGWDRSPANTALCFEDGLPRRSVLHDRSRPLVHLPRHSGALPPDARTVTLAELQAAVYGPLLTELLEPVVVGLSALTGLSRRVLWGNVGNLCADLFDKWRNHPAAAAERACLLDQPVLPFRPGRNPLYRTVRYEPSGAPDLPDQIRVRRTCCQRYWVPGTVHCYTCPLIPQSERVRLLRATLKTLPE